MFTLLPVQIALQMFSWGIFSWMPVNCILFLCKFLHFENIRRPRSPDAAWKGKRKNVKFTHQNCYYQSLGHRHLYVKDEYGCCLGKTLKILEKALLASLWSVTRSMGPTMQWGGSDFYRLTFMKMINCYWIVLRTFITARIELSPYIGS